MIFISINSPTWWLNPMFDGCIAICIYAYIYIYVMYIYIYIYTSVYIYIYVCVCVMYIYICIHMYTYIQCLDEINHSPWINLHFFQLTLEPFLRRLAPLAAESWTMVTWLVVLSNLPHPEKSWSSQKPCSKKWKNMETYGKKPYPLLDDDIPKIWWENIWKVINKPCSKPPPSRFTTYLINSLGLTISYTNDQMGFSESAPHSQPPTGDTPPPGSGGSGKD